ncbi:MAG: metal-sensing transcriptional repressor [Eubacteriales bacterium]
MDKECKCAQRTKERTDDERKKLIHRLNRIEGQIRGIRSMVEKNIYCADILIQSAAASAALSSFNRELLENHIRTCVASDIKNGNDETLDEVIGIIRKLMK